MYFGVICGKGELYDSYGRDLRLVIGLSLMTRDWNIVVTVLLKVEEQRDSKFEYINHIIKNCC